MLTTKKERRLRLSLLNVSRTLRAETGSVPFVAIVYLGLPHTRCISVLLLSGALRLGGIAEAVPFPDSWERGKCGFEPWFICPKPSSAPGIEESLGIIQPKHGQVRRSFHTGTLTPTRNTAASPNCNAVRVGPGCGGLIVADSIYRMLLRHMLSLRSFPALTFKGDR
jgi:hypothetical protein